MGCQKRKDRIKNESSREDFRVAPIMQKKKKNIKVWPLVVWAFVEKHQLEG